MSRQYQTRTSSQKSSSGKKQPQFTAPPVIQPKADKKAKAELPEWKPGGSGANPLAGLQQTAQAKLAIGQPNDKYEQEADRIALDVVQSIHSPVSDTLQQEKAVQREIEGNLPTPHISQDVPNSLQRYYRLDYDSYTLEKDDSQNARNPFTRREDSMSVQESGSGLDAMDFGMGWTTHLDQQPPLNVAGDGTLAINALEGEPKEFYATTNVIGNANTALSKVQSPIQLFAAGNKVIVPGREEGSEIELVMAQPKFAQEEAPGKEDFIKLQNHVCRDAAQHIIGNITHAVLKEEGGSKAAKIGTGDPTVVSGTHSLAEKISTQDLRMDEAVTSMESEGPLDTRPKVGQQYGTESRSSGSVPDRAEELGINQAAWASVGQGYVTQSISDAIGSKVDYAKIENPTQEFVWGYHYSSVLAESDAQTDQIAMENYNRDSDLKEGQELLLNKLKQKFGEELEDAIVLEGSAAQQIGQIIGYIDEWEDVSKKRAGELYQEMYQKYVKSLNNTWYFRMIGQEVGQSFHEQMTSTPYFINPMTLVVAKLSMNCLPITFDEGDTTLKDDQKRPLDRFVKSVKSTIHQGLPPKKIKLTGYGNAGWFKKGATSGETRAQTVKDYLILKGLDTNIIEVKGEKGNGRKVEIATEM